MRATNISRITGRKKLAEYLVALFRSKSVTFWVQLVGIQYWNVVITDKETILCQVIITYQLFLSVSLSGKDWLTDWWEPILIILIFGPLPLGEKGPMIWPLSVFFFFFLVRIHFMEGWTATMKHGVTKKKKREKVKAYRKSV